MSATYPLNLSTPMKLRNALPLVLVVSLACSETAAGERAEDAWADLRSMTHEKSEEFADGVERHLDEFGDALDELRDDAAAVGSDVSNEVERRVQELRAELDDLADETGDAWDEARDEIVDELEELEAYIDRHTS